MNSKEVRESFIKFFRGKDHRFVPSAPVIPFDDATLLFTNAGMNQFKPIFLGQEKPAHIRVVNSQKCIRVSGKHNDLEEVGVDTFHHTFFEMLGNWSFGNYYKAEAIRWAWELLTEVWGMDKNRLWATVYKDDEEAFKIWQEVTDIDPARILKFGKKDNFWEMGLTGPCGPCSEIHYYVGENMDQQSSSGVNTSDKYWELWNLVFIQNNRLEDGSLEELPAKHVDTGAGLERIVSVLQNKRSNYETDLFQPIIRKTEELTGMVYADNPIPFQVIADHIRMLSFSIADGGMPSNEGRGYVLRRILRRAARFGRNLGQHEPFVYKLVEILGETMGSIYPELLEKQIHIEKVIKAEETSFNETLDRGLNHFDKMLSNLSGKTISGTDAFRLYDTYGFPLDLTQLLAREKGLIVEAEGFKLEMTKQKKRAKAAGKFNKVTGSLAWVNVSTGSDSKFLGYESLISKSLIRKYAKSGDQIFLVLDKTPFYAESGGQIGDIGTINGDGISLVVEDVSKNGDSFVHVCKGEFDLGKINLTVECSVDKPQRQMIQKNHTATHLMHKALKTILGEHVQQAGSLVHYDYLRFDLTHFEKMTAGQIRQVEITVNREILENTPLHVSVKNFKTAKEEGATALFGEKYGETVRVVKVGDYSMELCGGTHVERTGDIGFFKIVEESSLASGIRRIVAVTGTKAVDYIQNQAQILEAVQSKLNCSINDIPARVEQLIDHRKELEKELKRNRKPGGGFNAKAVVSQGKILGNFTVIVSQVQTGSMTELKEMGDLLLGALKSGIGILGTQSGEKPGLVVVVSPDLVKAGVKAGDLARKIGAVMGGGGGGKPHLATAGGKDNAQLEAALLAGSSLIEKILKKTLDMENI